MQTLFQWKKMMKIPTSCGVIIIKESAEEGASSWIQYGEDENNFV